MASTRLRFTAMKNAHSIVTMPAKNRVRETATAASSKVDGLVAAAPAVTTKAIVPTQLT